jgi:DNA-binding PadR family transcriptional regulator
MNLRSTILGLLSWKPSSGYDLKRIISESEVFYWSGNNNQVYKTLLELQNEGMVAFKVKIQENLPTKKVYSITEKGISELRRSLLEPPELPELHKNFLIQLAWAEILSDGEIQVLMDQYVDDITDRLKMVQVQFDRSDDSSYRSPRERFLWNRIEDNLIRSYQTELDWVRQTRESFREGKFQDEGK